jgi:hypothetical protein
MQHVDDLVEDSLELLDDEEVESELFRSVATRLYDFQSHYEATPTYFRMMETHLEHDYFLELPLEAHPAYEAHADDFESRDAGRVSPVFREPGRDWDREENPVVGYICNDQLYVEVGSSLWESIVEAGDVTGDDAEPIEPMSLHGAIATVCRIASRRGDDELPLRWFASLGFHLVQNVDLDDDALLEQLQSDDDVGTIRDVVGAIDNLEMRLAHPDTDAEAPPPELRRAHPVLEWWYDVA